MSDPGFATAEPTTRQLSGVPTSRRPRAFWVFALPAIAGYLARTTPWGVLLAGCAGGTFVLALLAHFAGQVPLDQSAVRITYLAAVASLAFVPHTHFRPVIQTTPVPAWVAAAGQTLLALPVLAVTCWVQLRLMAGTIPPGVEHPPANYPLIAQLTAWSLLAAAIAICCERTRYAPLSGAIATFITAALIAGAEFTPALQRHLLTPPATPQSATIVWSLIAVTALALAGVACRDQWHRYTRRLFAPTSNPTQGQDHHG